MKRKKNPLKTITTLPTVAGVLALAASAHADPAAVFNYSFPTSWGGTGTAVTDQSAAGNNGSTLGTVSLSASVPSGAAGGTESINTTAGGVYTSATKLLNNTAVAAVGGFDYSVSFMWNGTDSTSFGHTEKIIDYAGTESLQLVTTAGSASLQMVFANDTGVESTAVSTTIAPNTWYNVNMFFNTEGNSLVGGDISGLASMVVNGGAPITGAATKGTYGDGLNRPIGVGLLGLTPYGRLVGFYGDVYDPTVTLIPEPSSLSLGLAGGFGALGMMWKARRRKS